MPSYGTIGFPLTHSFSKQYFNEKIARERIPDSFYESYPLQSISELPALLKQHPSLKGLSVTIPYKEQVLKYVTALSNEVKEIGAANCIRIRGNELKAFNTDIIGFEKSFEKKIRPGQNKALVLGTGGASKAVQYVLKKLEIDFLVVSRKENQLPNNITYHQLSKNILEDYRIVINATPVGMSPADDTCPGIPYTFLTADHYLYDLVYKPEKTLFLQKGEEQGATIENGFEMLIIQAEENWRIWNEE